MSEQRGYVDREAMARELDAMADKLAEIQSTLCDASVTAAQVRGKSVAPAVDWGPTRERLSKRRLVY